MLTILVQPVLKCMHFLHTIAVFVLSASYHVGRGISLLLIRTCNTLRDVFAILAIIGEELYRFLCELNTCIAAASCSIRNSANNGINCVLEAAGVFMKHMTKFVFNTRLHSKLLVTHIGNFVGEFLNVLRNALLLIADCAWWLITLLPKWLLSAIIVVGDFIVDSITYVRKALVYMTHIIVEDVFRLTIGIALLFLLWHNHRILGLAILRCLLKVKRVLRLCFRRIFRHRDGQASTNSLQILSIQRRPPLRLTSSSATESDKIDPTQRCVICKDHQKCVLLLPCKHLCLCEECAEYMFFSAQRQNCPLCRTFIDHTMSVYI